MQGVLRVKCRVVTRTPGFDLHWILWIFFSFFFLFGSVLWQDTSEPQPCDDETQKVRDENKIFLKAA